MIYIPTGILFTMEAGLIYGLPFHACSLYTNTAGLTLVQSTDPVMGASAVVSGTEGQYLATAGFISSDIDALVILKDY